jgi:uncharacterized OB-fold protein
LCASWTAGWRRVSGFGRLYSWVVVDSDAEPSFPLPYTLVLVELEDAPEVRLIGTLEGAPELRIGERMGVRFEDAEQGVVIPNWEPAG